MKTVLRKERGDGRQVLHLMDKSFEKVFSKTTYLDIVQHPDVSLRHRM